MKKDPTDWRRMFKQWKETGESPWEAGIRKELSKFKDGKESTLPKYRLGTEDDLDEEVYKDDIAAQQGYDEAKKFIENYSKSQGFKQRFLAGKWKEGFRNSKYDPAVNGQYIWDFTPRRLQIKPKPIRGNKDTEYNYDTREIEYTPLRIPKEKYDEVFSHEFGHALDSAIHRYLYNNIGKSINFTNRDVWNSYSRSIPILRQNKLYQNIIKQKKPQNERFVDRFAPYEYNHDAMPEENYADLIQMRYLSNKYGIFDSLKPNIKFTKEHLNKYKKLNVPTRFLHNFSDDQIIWMMNNVASTNKHTDNEV